MAKTHRKTRAMKLVAETNRHVQQLGQLLKCPVFHTLGFIWHRIRFLWGTHL